MPTRTYSPMQALHLTRLSRALNMVRELSLEAGTPSGPDEAKQRAAVLHQLKRAAWSFFLDAVDADLTDEAWTLVKRNRGGKLN